jgi:hypothetical protein
VGSRKLIGVLFGIVALVLAIFGVVAVLQPFLPPSGLHSGTIFDRGHQVVTVRYHDARIPIVKVRLDDGGVHTVESTPLFELAKRVGHPFKVDVEEDSNGGPKRIRFDGRWYGAGPPVWFWLGFGALVLVGAGFATRASVRRLRGPRPAPA